MTFQDRVIVVTGGASGMGRATATLLGSQGARVVIADIDTEAGSRVARAIGSNAFFDETDLTSLDDLEALAARTEERFGRIDGLANVAAVFPRHPFLETPRQAWQHVDDVCNRATFFLSQAVARSMIRTQTSGAIVNVASGAAFRPIPTMSAYGSAKGAVVSLSRGMAHELAPYNIRVNVMAPGHTASESTLRMVDVAGLEETAKTLVGGRWMEPEEPAEAIVFLLSDASRGMTGAVINVNLGNYMPH